MNKVRLPAWWFELRYGDTGPIAVAIVAVIVVFCAAVALGLPDWTGKRGEAAAEECLAHGGHIVMIPQRIGSVPTCYGR